MYATEPCGYIYFGAEGRMITVIEATGRKRPTDRNEFADALLASAAYTGRYRVDGNRWTTHGLARKARSKNRDHNGAPPPI